MGASMREHPYTAAMIERADITGLVLAGGRGRRMGGLDKGLQPYRGRALARHALDRLAPQAGALMLSANRHSTAYARMGVPVFADSTPDFAGPLAGFATGLAHCLTPWLVAVPCDAPLFPLDLVARLAEGAEQANAQVAIASTREPDGRRQLHPVFCLMHVSVLGDLLACLDAGDRKIDAWTTRHHRADVPFPDPRAFCNLNTAAELQALQHHD